MDEVFNTIFHKKKMKQALQSPAHQTALIDRLIDSMKTKAITALNQEITAEEANIDNLDKAIVILKKIKAAYNAMDESKVLTIDPDFLDDLEIHFLADVARDSNLNPYKLFKEVIVKKLENNVLATIHDEKSVFYRIINPDEIQHEKTLGGGMEKFAYHVEVVGGMIPFTNSEGQHNQISELESSEKTLTQEKQNLIQQVQEDRATYQRAKSQLKEAHQKELNEQKTFYSRKIKDLTSQLTTEKQTNSNLESQLHSQQEQNNLLKETNQTRQETIQTKNNRITQLENYLNESQKDQQTKQTLINSLQQEKINLQTKITHLTNQTTVQVSKLADQLTQINTQQADLLQKEAKLAKHKNKKALTKEEIKTLTENITNYQAKERDLTERIRVLEEKETRQRGALTQLLANRENELREMEENNDYFQGFIEGHKGTAVYYRPYRQICYTHKTIIDSYGICNLCSYYNNNPASRKELAGKEIEGVVPRLRKELNSCNLERKNSKKGKSGFLKITSDKSLTVDILTYELNGLEEPINVSIQYRDGQEALVRTKKEITELTANLSEEEKASLSFIDPSEIVLFFNNSYHQPNLENAEEIYLNEL
ncbi:14222_t:CDS:2, partial [Funneliformis geosporum]